MTDLNSPFPDDVVRSIFGIFEAEQLGGTFEWEKDVLAYQRLWLALTKTCRQFRRVAAQFRRVVTLQDNAAVRSFTSYHRRYPVHGLRIICAPHITARKSARLHRQVGPAVTHLSIPYKWMCSKKGYCMLESNITSVQSVSIYHVSWRIARYRGAGTNSRFWDLASRLERIDRVRNLQLSCLDIRLGLSISVHLRSLCLDGITFTSEESAVHFGRTCKMAVRELQLRNMSVTYSEVFCFLNAIGPSLDALTWYCSINDWLQYQSTRINPKEGAEGASLRSSWPWRLLSLDFGEENSRKTISAAGSLVPAIRALPSGLTSLSIRGILPPLAEALFAEFAANTVYLRHLRELPRLCPTGALGVATFHLCLGEDGIMNKTTALTALRARGIGISDHALETTVWGQ